MGESHMESPLLTTCHLPIRLQRDHLKGSEPGSLDAELQLVRQECLPIMICYETSVPFHVGHWAAGRWQYLLVTTNLGHFLTSNLEVKSSVFHYEILEVFYMNEGKSTFWIIKHMLCVPRSPWTQQMVPHCISKFAAPAAMMNSSIVQTPTTLDPKLSC